MDCKNVTSFSRLPDDYRVKFGVLMALLAFISSIENLMVLVVLLKFTVLHTTCNKILRSLALANFMTGLVALHAVQLLNNDARCLAWCSSIYVSLYIVRPMPTSYQATIIVYENEHFI